MNTMTTAGVRAQMRAYYDSLALNTALELGLFWQLDAAPQPVEQIAATLGMPVRRCRSWLELLVGLGYLECQDGQYAPTATARSAILEAFAGETWRNLAEEERRRYPFGVDLALHVGHPLAVWAGQNRMPYNYLEAIAGDPAYAQRFTRMLYDLHRALAGDIAAALDMRGVTRLMDLGGGSGVVARALLARHPALLAVVIDHPNVCVVGRSLAEGVAESGRISFVAADFLTDDLPAGFDMALECDVGVYSEALLGKIWRALNPGGRLVIVDEFDSPSRPATLLQRRHAFFRAMTTPESCDPFRPSLRKIQSLLARTGFQLSVEQTLSDGMIMIQGRK